jgi:alanine dehydrogenase
MTCCLGVPKEIKPMEGRVALTPSAVRELVAAGADVCLQAGAGLGSGFADAAYLEAGGRLLESAKAVYDAADLLVKVKEPYGDEVRLLRREQRLFSYLHLAALPKLTAELCELGVTAIGFETVAEHGGLPLLQPMSEIAGRIAIQVGAHLLHTTQGGRGMLLGGVPGVERGRVVVLGAGHAGGSAARLAAAMGARVQVFDRNPQRLGEMQAAAPNIEALYANREDMRQAASEADLLVGAVLLPGAAAPRLLTREDIGRMRQGSVVVDISVDQGGCLETTRPTTYDDPTYAVDGVTHFCVTNMPGAVPRSASQALSGALLPYLHRLIRDDWREHAALAAAINVEEGQIVHPALRQG